MRARHRSGGVAATLCAVLLSSTAFAVAASADPSPLTPTSRAEKLEILTREAEEERERLARRYASAQIPDMTPVRVVADDAWPQRMAECLSYYGVGRVLPRHSAAPDLNTSTLPREVVRQTCQLRYPKRSELHLVLGPFELRRLWSYHVFELQPCLRSLGISTSRSPGLGEYLTAQGVEDAWHPYRAIPRNASMRQLQYYDHLCPRFPDWMRG
ncbi:hypothetical protein ACFFGH_30385 [Lysobacter korlensis]|uniref:Uncharacterized protein n=1 Tax=Lysobacter korlensis TaxID=553636 RepID=A0ABV6RYV2_9GAMM